MNLDFLNIIIEDVERMCDFVLNYWDIEAAVENAPSLARSILRISAFLHS